MADATFYKKPFLLAFPVLLTAMPVHAAPVTNLYEITSGTYSELGGFVGVIEFDLPMSNQAFVELTIDHELNTGEMQILGDDLEPFRFFGFGSPFTGGTVVGSQISFFDATLQSDFGVQGTLSYTVRLDGDVLSLDGILFSEPVCCDIPFQFEHTGVHASLVPEPATATLLVLVAATFLLRPSRRVGVHVSGPT